MKGVLKLLVILYFSLFNTVSYGASELAELSNQVQQLLKADRELVNAEVVEQLSEKVLVNQQHFSNDILAKIFLLSANVASNQSDVNKVLHYAKKGLAANTLDKKTKLLLTLRQAEAHIIQKEFKQLLALTESAIEISNRIDSDKYHLLALSYRSVAFAVLGLHQYALADLQQVEAGISDSKLAEHIELLTVLALAYHHLGDHLTSKTMQLRILKLRFEMKQTKNLSKTYLYLGYAYFYLQRFNDAYNAFWESKLHAEQNNAPIAVAYANKMLGIVLMKQLQFTKAALPLQQAIKAFQSYQMKAEEIEATVALAKVKLKIDKTEQGYALLNKIIVLLDGKDISLEYAGFYRMVAEMHIVKKDFVKAYGWQEKHSKVLLKKLANNKKASSTMYKLSNLPGSKGVMSKTIEESRNLALKLAGNSELSSSFINKFEKQRVIIISLSALACIFLVTIVGFFMRIKSQRRDKAYHESEHPAFVMSNPMKTKFDYQLAFKKARKYQYPLSVCHLMIDNWQQLAFHFNKKSINEVTKDVAIVINEQLTEFDYAGQLNEGEYLLLFEHQDISEVSDKLDKLVQAVNSRSFANLGDFSITMSYSVNLPDFKDIDPYLFLARLTESVNIEQVQPPQIDQSKVS